MISRERIRIANKKARRRMRILTSTVTPYEFDSIESYHKWWYSTRGMYRQHGKPCSCWMCGNPRRWGFEGWDYNTKRKIAVCNEQLKEYLEAA